MFWQQLLNSILDILPALSILLLLHFLRNAIGNHSLHILMGVFVILSMTSGLPFFLESFINPAESLGLGYGNITIAVFSTLLMIYEIHGTHETQRLLLGLILTLLALGLFTSLSVNSYFSIMIELARRQNHLMGIMEVLRRGIFIFIISNLLFCLALPVIFQFLRNLHLSFFGALLFCNCAILLTKLTDTILAWNQIPSRGILLALLAQVLALAVISGIVATYVRLTRTNVREPQNSFSIFSNVFRHLLSTEKLRQAMAEWQEQYQAVLNHCVELIFILDNKGRVLNANLAAIKILGDNLSLHKPIGSYITYSQGTPFVLPSVSFPGLSQEPALTTPCRFHNMFLVTSKGTPKLEIDFNLTNAAIEGEPLYLLIAHDMTEYNEQQRREQKLQEQLFHSQRLESLGALAGGVAHDFNNMLHSVQGNTDLLRQFKMPQQASEMLNSIDAATDRASQLVSQLLGFARKGSLNLTTLELAPLLKQTEQLFLPTARGITFKTLLEPGCILVTADAMQLQQVILNLLINARDALASTPENPAPKIVLRLENLRPQTHECVHGPIQEVNPDQYACIKVKDNGPGIPENVLPHVFEPFFTTKGIGKGTGMGLAMAYGCITSLHGWIDIVSTPGKGTEFTIVLPKATAQEHSA